MSGHAMLAFAFLAGAGFGAVVARAWFERCGRPREIKIVIDKELARQIDERIVMGWLNSRGLVWQPKGIDFKVKAPKP